MYMSIMLIKTKKKKGAPQPWLETRVCRWSELDSDRAMDGDADAEASCGASEVLRSHRDEAASQTKIHGAVWMAPLVTV